LEVNRKRSIYKDCWGTSICEHNRIKGEHNGIVSTCNHIMSAFKHSGG
jgi:hypothetical protein